MGNIPNGAGLSSSASLEVLTGVILTDLYGITDLSPIDLALFGQYSENNFNGCNCGIMDQFTVAVGKKTTQYFLTQTLCNMNMHPFFLRTPRSSLQTVK